MLVCKKVFFQQAIHCISLHLSDRIQFVMQKVCKVLEGRGLWFQVLFHSYLFSSLSHICPDLFLTFLNINLLHSDPRQIILFLVQSFSVRTQATSSSSLNLQLSPIDLHFDTIEMFCLPVVPNLFFLLLWNYNLSLNLLSFDCIFRKRKRNIYDQFIFLKQNFQLHHQEN